ncbi:MAG: MarR family transcriptional regulator [Kineothrix sp.]|nr:MarR family transcriptional regulator [Kineothrix sp.]NBI90159.1 MarR family transcriptional regulator [Lachnospiraceae bacterium]
MVTDMENRQFHNGELIKRINDKVEKTINNELLTYELTSTQFKMLVALHLSPGHTASLKDLEKYFGVAQSTAAGIIARLERKNLIVSFNDKNDKRIKHVRISDEGLRICLSVRESIIETECKLFSGLLPEEQTELNRLLHKVYRSINS